MKIIYVIQNEKLEYLDWYFGEIFFSKNIEDLRNGKFEDRVEAEDYILKHLDEMEDGIILSVVEKYIKQ